MTFAKQSKYCRLYDCVMLKMWMEKHQHRKGAYEYNKKWEDFFNDHQDVPATYEEIMKKLSELNNSLH